MRRNRVLIVDDDPQIRRLVVRMLQMDGIEVLAAESTREAERMLEGKPVDILLCDHYMPDENGMPFLQRVKKQYPRMMRVLVTGCGEVGVGVDAINKAQVQACMTKPFGGGELRALVGRLLDRCVEAAVKPHRAFTQDRLRELSQLDFDHPGIGEVQRDNKGAVTIEDDLEDLAKAFDDWSQFEDSPEIKTHEDVLGLSEDFAKLVGA